jgi:septum formation protein
MKRKLILASASPRRKELLENIGLDFEICPADIDESVLPGEDAAAYPLRIAMKKALAVAENKKDAIVIAADTVVIVDDDILGKPKCVEEAKAMLQRLSGREHIVITGIGLVDTSSKRTLSCAEQTIVYFHPLREEEIDAYLVTSEPMDKAGAYGIQGYGGLLVRKIEGDYFNVMGLPLSRLYRLLQNFDVDMLKKTGF